MQGRSIRTSPWSQSIPVYTWSVRVWSIYFNPLPDVIVEFSQSLFKFGNVAWRSGLLPWGPVSSIKAAAASKLRRVPECNTRGTKKASNWSRNRVALSRVRRPVPSTIGWRGWTRSGTSPKNWILKSCNPVFVSEHHTSVDRGGERDIWKARY